MPHLRGSGVAGHSGLFRDEFHDEVLPPSLPPSTSQEGPVRFGGFVLAGGRQLACLPRRQREGCAAPWRSGVRFARSGQPKSDIRHDSPSFSFILIIVGRPPSAGSHHNPSMPVDELASSANQRKKWASDAKTAGRGARTLRS